MLCGEDGLHSVNYWYPSFANETFIPKKGPGQG